MMGKPLGRDASQCTTPFLCRLAILKMEKTHSVAKKLPKYLHNNNFFVTFASSEMTK